VAEQVGREAELRPDQAPKVNVALVNKVVFKRFKRPSRSGIGTWH